MSDTSKNLQQIFDLEIGRLTELASEGPLEFDEVRRLETLTRAYRTYNSTTAKDTDTEDAAKDVSTADLLAIARTSQPHDNKARRIKTDADQGSGEEGQTDSPD